LLAGCLVALSSFASAAESCGQFPSTGFDGPDMTRIVGRYVDVQYRYAVTVPAGVTGYTNASPLPDHGFGIVLSWAPRSYLSVDGTYDAVEWKTADAAARTLLQWDRESSTRVLSHARSHVRLGALAAIRQVIRHRCANLPDVYVDDDVVTVDAKRGVVYKVSLTTTETRYRRDEAVMDQMLSTWRTTQ
jgi:hypothetical protein